MKKRFNHNFTISLRRQTFKELRFLFYYGIIGIIAASADTSVFFVMLKSIRVDILLANTLGVIVGVLISFTLNSFINFKYSLSKKRLFRFSSIALFGLLISNIIIWLGVKKLDFLPLYVKIVAISFSAMTQYVLNRTWTFSHKFNAE